MAMAYAFDSPVNQMLRVYVEDAYLLRAEPAIAAGSPEPPPTEQRARSLSTPVSPPMSHNTDDVDLTGGVLVPAQLESPIRLRFSFVSEGEERTLDILQYDDKSTRVIIFADTIEAARRAYGMPELIVGESLVSEFILAIPGIGVSVVDSSPHDPTPDDQLARATARVDDLAHTEELFYVFVSGVMINSCTTTAFVKRYLTVSEVDVYNQRRDAGSGLLFLTRAGGKDETGAGVPVIQLSRVTRLPQLGEGRGFASDR